MSSATFRARPGRRSSRLSRFAAPATTAPPTRVSTAPRARARPAPGRSISAADTRPVTAEPEDLHRPGRDSPWARAVEVSPQPLAARVAGQVVERAEGAAPRAPTAGPGPAAVAARRAAPGEGRALEQGHRLARVVGAVPQPRSPGRCVPQQPQGQDGGASPRWLLRQGPEPSGRPTWSPGPGTAALASAVEAVLPYAARELLGRAEHDAGLAHRHLGVRRPWSAAWLVSSPGGPPSRPTPGGCPPGLPSAPPAPHRCPPRRGHRQGGLRAVAWLVRVLSRAALDGAADHDCPRRRR